MCLGGQRPQAPQVVYQGPSEEDIRRNQQNLADFQRRMTDQQAEFENTLQAFIDDSDQEIADLESTYSGLLTDATTSAETKVSDAATDAEMAEQQAQSDAAGDLAAAASGGVTEQAGAYKVSVTESEPVNAQTTKAITDKKKPKSSLKITQNAVEASSGTGLNIGI